MSEHAQDHPLDLLSPYLDGELRVEERDQVEAHLASCAACGAHLDALRRLASAIRAEPVPPVPEGLGDRIARRLDAAGVVPFRKRFAVPATIAATIAAVGLVLVVAWRGERTDMGEPHAPARKDAPESVPQERAEPPSGFKDVPSSAPAAPPPPPPAKRRDDASDLLKQDRAKVEAKKPAEPQAAPRAEHDEGSGVPGGVVGGVAGGVQGGTAEDEDVALQKEERQANDELTRKVSTTPAPAPTAAAVKESLASVCGTDVADAPARASWVVRDRAAATRQLAALAAGHGGALQQPDPSAPGQLVVVVPTSRYDAFLAAARATGVQIEGATVPPGGTCVRQRIDLAPPPAD